jgi:hypothetical protein
MRFCLAPAFPLQLTFLRVKKARAIVLLVYRHCFREFSMAATVVLLALCRSERGIDDRLRLLEDLL